MIRRFALLGVATAVTLAVAGCGGSASDDDLGADAKIAVPTNVPDLKGQSLTFTSFGGQGLELQQQAWLDPFSEASGAKIQQDSPPDTSKLSAQVDSGNVTWDVFAADPYFPMANCGTLAEKLDIDTSAIDPKYVTDECSVPVDRFAYHLVYKKSAFGDDPPTSWADYFDTKKYPGKRGMWSYAGQNQLEFALLGDGVSPDQLYPLDIDRAIKKLDTIKDDVVTWDTQAQSVEQLLNGEVAMSIVVNTRSYAAISQGADYAPVWNQNIQSWDAFMIPKGSKNLEAAKAFMQFLAGPEAQQNILNVLPFAPTLKDPLTSGDPKVNEFSPGSDEIDRGAILQDQDFYAKNFAKVNDAFNNWLNG